MIIISHDRHFLNSVCTHMADLDYGELRVYPGNYDEYMTAATQARERLLADNAKKKAQIADLQSFVSRFSANASKSSQATSRLKQIDKIKIEEVKVSSRQNPFIRFEQEKKLYRNILEIEGVSKGYGEAPLFKGLNMMLEVGEKVAILGTNGIGKSTLIKTLVGALAPDTGTIKWSENAQIGYYARITPRTSTPISTCSTGWLSGNRRTKTSRQYAPYWAVCCSPRTTSRSRSRCCQVVSRAACCLES